MTLNSEAFTCSLSFLKALVYSCIYSKSVKLHVLPKGYFGMVKSSYQEQRQLELVSGPVQEPLLCLAALGSQLSVLSSLAFLFKGRNSVFMFAELGEDQDSAGSG